MSLMSQPFGLVSMNCAATASHIHGAKVHNFSDIVIQWAKKSHKHLASVHHKDAAFAALSDLVAVEQLELSCSFIVFILDADASFPFLDFAFRSPQLDVNGLWAVEHQAGC